MSEESKSWYRMSRPLFNSGMEDDEFWAYGQDGFQEQLNSVLGCDVLIYDKAVYKQPQRVRAIVQQKISDVYNSSMVRQILCNIGILHCGQYVQYNNTLWMVSGYPDNNRIYEKAVLWKCKHTIRFISPLTGKIVEYPVYSTNSTQYGTGVSEKTNVDVGADQHLVYIPYNEETVLLDDDFRFIMDKNHVQPTVYRITRVDTVSQAVGEEQFDDGLIQWAVLEDRFNDATDSREELIADFFSVASGESEKTPGAGGTLTLTPLDGDFTIAVGDTKQIRVGCVLPDGTEAVKFAYDLDYDLSNGAAKVVSESDNIITLQANDNVALVGLPLTIRAYDDAMGSEAKIKINIVNW